MNINDLKGLNIVVFDLEIKENPEDLPNKWKDWNLFGISSAVLYDFLIDRFLIYTDDNMQECADRINSSELVVGFNNIYFDNKVMKVTNPEYEITLPIEKQIDLYKDICSELKLAIRDRKGFGLAPIGELNVKRSKIGSGAHAPQLFKEGRWGELITYNIDDVALTRDLFIKAIEDGGLITPRGFCKLNYCALEF